MLADVADLDRLPLLAGVGAADRARLLASSRTVTLASRQVLFRQGRPATRFFFVLRGQIKLFRASNPYEQAVLDLIGPGQPIVETLCLDDAARYPVGAEAVRRSEVLAIEAATFLDVLRASGDAWLRLMRELTCRMCGYLAHIELLSRGEARVRVAAHLVDAPATIDGPDARVVRLQSAKHVLAAKLGMTPETFSRALGQLVRYGLITVDGAVVTLIEPRKLRALAGRTCDIGSAACAGAPPRCGTRP